MLITLDIRVRRQVATVYVNGVKVAGLTARSLYTYANGSSEWDTQSMLVADDVRNHVAKYVVSILRQ